MSVIAATVKDESSIESAVESVSRPTGVKHGRISFDVDHSGEPAIRIVFPVTTRIPLTPARVKELSVFRRSVRDAVRALGFDSFPYVRLEDAR